MRISSQRSASLAARRVVPSPPGPRSATFTKKRSVTFEYTLLDGVNDHPEHARALVKILRSLPSKLNLIPFNPFPGTSYRCSSTERIQAFQDIVREGGLIATVRKTRGDDIDAACGQLAGDFRDRTRRRQMLRAERQES